MYEDVWRNRWEFLEKKMNSINSLKFERLSIKAIKKNAKNGRVRRKDTVEN